MAYKLVFNTIGYYPRLKSLIIGRSWRGGSTSLATESGASAVGATSGEELEDEEGLHEE